MIKKKIYLDYAATTPLDPRILKVMLPYFSKKFGNTMSLHFFGQEAKQILEESREIIAKSIKANPDEIIFTSSATESNNLALKGVALASLGGPAFAKASAGKHIIISPIEHPCVNESAKWLLSQGFEITKLPVDKYGLINPKDVQKAIKKDTILVSVIHASNEIGTIQPIEEIGKIIKSKVKSQKSKVYFHTDAVQSFTRIPIDVNKMNIDLLTASSHKIYGPKGVAFLFVRNGVKIQPLIHGGGQEKGLRSSTVNLPAIVGFAEAVKIYRKETKKEIKRLSRLRDKLIEGVLKKIPNSFLNGPPTTLRVAMRAGPPATLRVAMRAGHPQKRLANNANFWFQGVEGESIVIHLDFLGIAGSTGSACSSSKLEPSHILLALGLKPEQAHGSLRLTLGRWTKEKDINYVLEVLPKIIKKLRKISPFK